MPYPPAPTLTPTSQTDANKRGGSGTREQKGEGAQREQKGAGREQKGEGAAREQKGEGAGREQQGDCHELFRPDSPHGVR